MSRRCALALAVLLAPVVAIHDAAANGRPPGTSTIHFRHGHEADIVAGMSFGLLLSHDSGATWYWMCETAVGYGGTYDPDYEYTATGALFATTYTGIKVQRDGCTFGAPNTTSFVSTVAQGPDGEMYYGAADTPMGGNPGDTNIYRSGDDGMTWQGASAPPGIPNDWWQSLEVAPSNGSRLYLAGYRTVAGPSGNTKMYLLFRSDDGGDTWQALPTTAFATMPNSTIEIAAISPVDPDVVFARVKLEDNMVSDAIYRSLDKGMTWERLFGKPAAISLLARRNGELVEATQTLGARRSTDNGKTWTDLVDPPHIGCLAENSAGEVWACTQNYGGMQGLGDGYGIMKSTDLVTWTPVLKYQEIKAPVACADGTPQQTTCDQQMWCGLCSQLGCDAGRPECGGPVEAPVDPGDKGGCCKGSAAPAPGALVLVFGAAALLLRPRRRRR